METVFHAGFWHFREEAFLLVLNRFFFLFALMIYRSQGPFFIHLLIDLSETSFEVHSKFRGNPAGNFISVESQVQQLTQVEEQNLKFL